MVGLEVDGIFRNLTFGNIARHAVGAGIGVFGVVISGVHARSAELDGQGAVVEVTRFTVVFAF